MDPPNSFPRTGEEKRKHRGLGKSPSPPRPPLFPSLARIPRNVLCVHGAKARYHPKISMNGQPRTKSSLSPPQRLCLKSRCESFRSEFHTPKPHNTTKGFADVFQTHQIATNTKASLFPTDCFPFPILGKNREKKKGVQFPKVRLQQRHLDFLDLKHSMFLEIPRWDGQFQNNNNKRCSSRFGESQLEKGGRELF